MEKLGPYRWNREDPDGDGGKSLQDLLLRAGLWISLSLWLASSLPGPLVAVAVKGTLIPLALAVSLVAWLKGERPIASALNGHDLAVVLLAVAMIAGVFVDGEAVAGLLETNGGSIEATLR